jgi:hypothetical protein
MLLLGEICSSNDDQVAAFMAEGLDLMEQALF